MQQIARLERFCGAWERIALSSAVASPELRDAAVKRGAQALLELDSTSPADLGNGARDRALAAIITAHSAELDLSLAGVSQIHRLLVDEAPETFGENTDLDTVDLRQLALSFTKPGDEDVVFPTISAFLVEKRLRELLEWADSELEAGVLHPLILAWHLLEDNGFDFVNYSHFAPQLLKRSRQYFASLRQAEKTARGTWSTLNSWLELFLDSLVTSAIELDQISRKNVETKRLTSVQQQILEVVKLRGAVTREGIANDTGIKLSTVKYNLSVLSARGHLKRQGGGRTPSYILL